MGISFSYLTSSFAYPRDNVIRPLNQLCPEMQKIELFHIGGQIKYSNDCLFKMRAVGLININTKNVKGDHHL